MLSEVFKSLDDWIEQENLQRREDGLFPLQNAEIRIVGQMAIIEADLQIHAATTMDVDAFLKTEYLIKRRFEELLKARGLILDPMSDFVWMPEETRYQLFFEGTCVQAYLAEAPFVLLSKAKHAPEKNRYLIENYLATSPPDEFFDLCEKYGVDLERFVQ